MSAAEANTAAKAKPCTVLEALNMAMHDAMAADEKVVILGEDVADPEEGGVVGVSKGLSTKFGELRVKTTPISEQAIVGAAIGASLVGYKAVAEIMLMNFTTVAMDMIVNHAAKLRYMSGGQTHVPIVIRTMTGAGFSTGGQHADFLEAWFAHTAGIKVVCPTNPMDAYGLLRAAIDDPDPVLMVETMPLYWTQGERPTSDHRVEIGKARIATEGSDVTIVTYARTAAEAMGALAAAVNCALELASAAAACLAARSSIARTNFLYGDQKACRMLIGFSTILVIVASQSRPARS